MHRLTHPMVTSNARSRFCHSTAWVTSRTEKFYFEKIGYCFFFWDLKLFSSNGMYCDCFEKALGLCFLSRTGKWHYWFMDGDWCNSPAFSTRAGSRGTSRGFARGAVGPEGKPRGWARGGRARHTLTASFKNWPAPTVTASKFLNSKTSSFVTSTFFIQRHVLTASLKIDPHLLWPLLKYCGTVLCIQDW